MQTELARLYNPLEVSHGRRHSAHVQRLWTRVHFYRCRSDVLSGTWLFNAQALQELPSGTQKRTRWIRWWWWLSFSSRTGNARHLFWMRAAHYGSVWAARGSSRLLPRLLSGPQGQQQWWRTRSRTLL